jgi:transcriptional regulator with XRE-family HTH domain
MIDGLAIRDLRKKKGLIQQALADLVGVSKTTVLDWEKGRYFPEGKNLTNLANALGVSAAYLLGETDDPHPPLSAKITMSSKMTAGEIYSEKVDAQHQSNAGSKPEDKRVDFSVKPPKEGIVISRKVGNETVTIEIPPGGEHLIKDTLDVVWQRLNGEPPQQEEALDPRLEVLIKMWKDATDEEKNNIFRALSGEEQKEDESLIQEGA